MTRREAFHIWRTYDVLRGVILSLTEGFTPASCDCCRRKGKTTDFTFCPAMACRCCLDCFVPLASDFASSDCGNHHVIFDVEQWGLQYAVDYKQGHPEDYQMYPDGASATI